MRKRLTKFRKDIVDLLDKSKIPICVKEIHESWKDVDLSTVYRALEYLESVGSVKSITVPCSCGPSRYYHTQKKHMHYLYCEVCHNFFSVPYCGLKTNLENDIIANYNFDITGHVLLFFGKCAGCR